MAIYAFVCVWFNCCTALKETTQIRYKDLTCIELHHTEVKRHGLKQTETNQIPWFKGDQMLL